MRNITLRSTQMPKEFVEFPAFRIFLPLNDPPVIVQCDGALLPKFDLRPKVPRNQRQGSHCKTEIVEFSQMEVGAYDADLNAFQKMFVSACRIAFIPRTEHCLSRFVGFTTFGISDRSKEFDGKLRCTRLRKERPKYWLAKLMKIRTKLICAFSVVTLMTLGVSMLAFAQINPALRV
jgi:hypothetical protein